MKAIIKIHILVLLMTYASSLEAQSLYIYQDDKLVDVLSASEGNRFVFHSELNHEYVNLALPSGTIWAACNIGAESPQDAGFYFAWGEVIPQAQNQYSWSTYRWCAEANATSTSLTKYCTSDDYGIVDGKKTLDAEDDAATANWGERWEMPSKVQMQELLDPENTVITFTNSGSGKFYSIKSRRNAKVLILPASGFYSDGNSGGGDRGYYWSGESDGMDKGYGMMLDGSKSDGAALRLRRNGYSVRAVLKM